MTGFYLGEETTRFSEKKGGGRGTTSIISSHIGDGTSITGAHTGVGKVRGRELDNRFSRRG